MSTTTTLRRFNGNLLDFQINPAKELALSIDRAREQANNIGALLVAPAGTGKTYMIGAGLEFSAFFSKEKPIGTEDSFKFSNLLIILPQPIRIQFSRVLIEHGITNFVTVSPAAMVRNFGKVYYKWITRIIRGSPALYPVWYEDTKPDTIVIDEGQICKNADATITRVALSAVDQGIQVFLSSATPFTKLSETMLTCRALGLISNELSHKAFCSQFGEYDEYSPAAMRAFNNYLVERRLKIEPHGIKFAHRVFNKCRLINFRRPEHAQIYKKAYETWLEECAKQNKSTPEGIAAIWVATNKFRECAEMLRAEDLAELAYEQVNQKDKSKRKQSLIASNFRNTLELVRQILIQKYHVPESYISTIIGGQTPQIRQENIDKFQRGDSDYCLLTLKSGGAGLSLHHEAKYPRARPRYCLLPPTWSAIELVQVLGRAHRITSISTTRQDIIWYRGTVEEDVAAAVGRKMASMREIVNKREQWFDLMAGGNLHVSDNEDESTSELIKRQLHKETEDLDAEGVSEIDGMATEAYANEHEEEALTVEE